MFSISEPITNAEDAVRYYLDYYVGENNARFFGEGAKFLQLPKQVNQETLLSLFKGYSQDGSRELVKNAGKEGRTCGWDFTLSAPKPYSALWAVLPDAEREELESLHREAVEETLKTAEELFGVVRRGKGGKDHQKAGLTFAVVDEYTSRAHNMQMHSHCLLVNTGVTEDGHTGAIHSINFFRAKKLLGALYQAGLAAKVSKRFNLTVTPEGQGFGIEGVPKDFCRSQSKRRIAIEKAMKQRGLISAQAAKIAAQDTRPSKQHVALEKLFPVWHEAARSFGWGPEQALKLIRSQPQKITATQSFEQAAKQAVTKIKKEDRTRKNVLCAVKNTAIEHGVSGARLLKTLEDTRLPDGEHLVYQPAHKANRIEQSQAVPKKQPATKASHAAEAASKRDAKKPKDVPTPKASEHQPETPAAQKPELLPAVIRHNRTTEHGNHTRQKGERANESEQHRQLGGADAHREKTRGDRASGGQKSANSHSHAKAQKAKAEKNYQPSPEQQRRNLEFTRQFGAWVDRIWAERQTRDRLTRIAHVLAKRYGADRETLDRTLEEMRPGAERSFVHVKSPRVFPNSPLESLKWARVPKIAVGDKQPTWGEIKWKHNLPLGELRLQSKRLFTNAPKWSPFHGLEIPALRFSLKRSDSERSQKSKNSAKPSVNQSKRKTKDQSQSH